MLALSSLVLYLFLTQHDFKYSRHTIAAGLYPWSTAESIMRYTRRTSLPTLPQSLPDLASRFENGELNRFSCCDSPIFRGCVRDTEGKKYFYICILYIQVSYYFQLQYLFRWESKSSWYF